MKRRILTPPSPYVGLRPFSEREALLFFGREQHVRDILAKLEGQQRFLAVLGASGSGKSSLVHAGVVPALHRGALTSAGHSWNVCTLTPGNAPLANLAQALAKHLALCDSDDSAFTLAWLGASLALSPLALTELYRAGAFGGQALLLVIDQFEEIFRYRQKNIDEAESFINLLLRSASEDVPIYVVITMSSEFLGPSVAFIGLPEAINLGIYLPPRLGPDQLKSIIASPLVLVGGEIDPVLRSRLVNGLGSKDDLPILQHALLRMWDHARADGRSRIEERDFDEVCAPHDKSGQTTLSNAINNHAAQIYHALTERQQLVARQVFLSLVERLESGDVRRPLSLRQLVEEVGEQEREDVKVVIDAFRTDHVGFLRPSINTPLTDERVIDISHESLFRQWYLLKCWLEEEAKDAGELKEWQSHTDEHKQDGGLLEGNRCQRAHQWRERVKSRPDPSAWAQRYSGPTSNAKYGEVDDYIKRSIQRVDRIKAGRRWKRIAIMVGGPPILIIVVGLIYWTNFYSPKTIRTDPGLAKEFEEITPGPCPFGGQPKLRENKLAECEVMEINPATLSPKFHRTEGQLFYYKEWINCPYAPQIFARIRGDGNRCIIEAPNNLTLYHTRNTVYYRPFLKSKAEMTGKKEGWDLYGEDYRDFLVVGMEGADICSNECALDEQCSAFSFSRKRNQCWLKDRIPEEKREDSDIVSGEKIVKQR